VDGKMDDWAKMLGGVMTMDTKGRGTKGTLAIDIKYACLNDSPAMNLDGAFPAMRRRSFCLLTSHLVRARHSRQTLTSLAAPLETWFCLVVTEGKVAHDAC